MGKQFNRPSRGYASYDSALNGVAGYQQKNHPNIINNNGMDGNQYFSKLSHLMRDFLRENNLPLKDNGSHFAMTFNSNMIQDNWKDFKQYLKTKNHE